MCHASSGQKSQKGRWRSIDAGVDASDDQQDIARGRQMVDTLFQGGGGERGLSHWGRFGHGTLAIQAARASLLAFCTHPSPTPPTHHPPPHLPTHEQAWAAPTTPS